MADKNEKVITIEPEKVAGDPEEKRGFFATVKGWFHKDKKEPDNSEETEGENERRTFGEWLSDCWYWIAGGGVALIAFILLYAKYASDNSEEESVDPEIETEPGDWEPSDLFSSEEPEESSDNNSSEE